MILNSESRKDLYLKFMLNRKFFKLAYKKERKRNPQKVQTSHDNHFLFKTL